SSSCFCFCPFTYLVLHSFPTRRSSDLARACGRCEGRQRYVESIPKFCLYPLRPRRSSFRPEISESAGERRRRMSVGARILPCSSQNLAKFLHGDQAVLRLSLYTELFIRAANH